MSIVAPKGRKHLSADALFRLVRSGFATIPDDRGGEPEISLTDALMSAFAMFSLKSPSLLAFDKQRVRGQFGSHLRHWACALRHARCGRDSIRSPLNLLRPLFKSVFRQLQRGKALEPMAFLGWPLLVGSRWDGVFFLSDDSLRVVSAKDPPERQRDVFSSDVGRGDCPSGLSGSSNSHFEF